VTALTAVAPAPQQEALLGRDATRVGVVLDHPSVSRAHAGLRNTGDHLVIRDLGSTNGSFANGQRIDGEVMLRDGDVLEVGPFGWTVVGLRLEPRSGGRAPEIRASEVTKRVRTSEGPRTLLHGVSVDLRPGSMVAVLGPSGCGKSTLLRILSGRDRQTSGLVNYAGRDLVEHFSALKHAIAFVPQRETLPEDLVVESALEFTARLRLPADSDRSETLRAVELALDRVGILEHRYSKIAQLSGGQRKRVALANELIAQPQVLFLDEVTSGLDDATDRAIMRLLQELAAEGMTVICVTHTVSNVPETCSDLVVLAPGGHLAFQGPPSQAPGHFQCGGLPEIYEALTRAPAESWADRSATQEFHEAQETHEASHQNMGTTSSVEPHDRVEDRRPLLAQLWVLLQRNVAVALGDPKALGLALAQAAAVGVLFRLAYGAGQPAPGPALQFAFLVGVSAFWFGCSNGSKELVKERALFRLERDINLRIPSYVLSKVLLLTLLGSAQVVLLHGTLAVTGVTLPHVRTLFLLNLAVVVVGSCLGLLISAYAERPSQAATVVPMALIPQIVLSAAVVQDLPQTAEWIAKVVVSAFWLYRVQLNAFGAPEVAAGVALSALALHGVAATVGTMLLLRRRESVG